MNAVADIKSQFASLSGRSFIWLIKREFWEHRGRLVITPLVIATILILGVLISALRFGALSVDFGPVQFGRMDGVARSGVQFGFLVAVAAIFAFVMIFVIAYYVLDALYAERRDRSVLFWKSMPLSDVETVLSKLAVASLVAPAFSTLVAIVTGAIMMLIMSVTFSAHGGDFGLVWRAIPIFDNVILVLYSLVVWSLWYVPVVAWGLLASAWARRAPFLWATVPVAAAVVFEYLAFRTNYLVQLIEHSTEDGLRLAFAIPVLQGRGVTEAVSVFDLMTPIRFFGSADVWVGVMIAALLVAATVWVRRYRDVT